MLTFARPRDPRAMLAYKFARRGRRTARNSVIRGGDAVTNRGALEVSQLIESARARGAIAGDAVVRRLEELTGASFAKATLVSLFVPFP